MAREHNFLLGRGEQLSTPVDVPRGGGEKHAPYTFEAAKSRIAPKLVQAQRQIAQLPREACPNDEAVAVITMHPRYISKSDFPSALLDRVGLRAVGSRSRKVRPEEWGVQKHPDEAITEEIFVAGKRSSLTQWSAELPQWSENQASVSQIRHIEDVRSQAPVEKLKGIEAGQTPVLLEIVIHDGDNDSIFEAFLGYAKSLGAVPIEDRRREVHGLSRGALNRGSCEGTGAPRAISRR